MVASPGNNSGHTGPSTPNQAKSDYDEMMSFIEGLADKPEDRPTPRRYGTTEHHADKEENITLTHQTYEEDGDVYAYVDGYLPVRLCYDCHQRFPYYKGQCKPCRTEYQRKNLIRARTKRRMKMYDVLGNVCVICETPYNPNVHPANVVLSTKPEYYVKGERLEQKIINLAEDKWLDAMQYLELRCLSCKRYQDNGYDSKVEILLKHGEENEKNRDIKF